MTTGDSYFLISDIDAKKIVKDMLLTVDDNGTSVNSELRDIINIEEWKDIKTFERNKI